MNLKVTVVNPEDNVKTKPMSEMEPGEICQVVGGDYNKHYCMRNRDPDFFEVIDFIEDIFWDKMGASSEKVKPVPVGTQIIITVF